MDSAPELFGVEPGVYPDMSEDEYHSDPCASPSLSSSIAKVICMKSALHAAVAHPRIKTGMEEDTDDAPSTAQSIGKVAHKLMLGSDDKVAVSPFDSFRTKEAKEWRDKQQAAGVAIVTEETYERAERMVARGCDQLAKMGLSFTGHSERVIVWRESNGILCRSRLDDLPPAPELGKSLIDYKTTGSCAAGGEFDRHLYDLGYDIQAAFYTRGIEDLFGHQCELWFAVQETSPPYELVIHRPSGEGIERGRFFVEHAIKTWGECLKSNNWPGYQDRFWNSAPKPWHMPAAMAERAEIPSEEKISQHIGLYEP